MTVTDAGGATGSASAAVTATSLLLIAASSGGLGVASAQGQAIQPMEGVSTRVTPNPVRGDAHLMFTTSRAGLVTVRIFDLRGRVVRRPWDGIIASAGEHVVPLGARDGGSMRAGIYYFEVRSPDGVKAGRFVILK